MLKIVIEKSTLIIDVPKTLFLKVKLSLKMFLTIGKGWRVLGMCIEGLQSLG